LPIVAIFFLDTSTFDDGTNFNMLTLLTGRSDYKCDFERYGSCGLEQSTGDEKDWAVIPSGSFNFNGPSTDHTRHSNTGQ